MTDAIKTTTGTAVRVADVENKLNELWAQAAGEDSVLLRATTLNLIVCTNEPEKALTLTSYLPERHPCRLIMVVTTDQPGTTIQAIPAILLRAAFGRELRNQVFGEQITLSAGRDAVDRVLGAVQGLLLSDHPVFLFYHGELSPADPLLKGLSDVLDQVIVDSADFSEGENGLRALTTVLDLPHFYGTLNDLNWQRLLPWCVALAQQFDPPNDRVALSTVNGVEITHHQARGEALLMFGWLADRLNWRVLPGAQRDEWLARSASGTVALRLKTAKDETSGVQRITLGTQNGTYSIDYVPEDSCLIMRSGSQTMVRASAPMETGALLNLALDSSGREDLYERALHIAVTLSTSATSIGQRAGTIVVQDAAALSRIAAREFVLIARQAVRRHGRFTVALSGGSTPRALFELLAQSPYVDQVPWAQTHIFWGDERDVPTDHPDSNQRMAREALLERVPLPPGNIHAILIGQLNAVAAAARYAAEMRAFFGLAEADLPQFDLILLGLGDDGHTASLFPHTAALNAKGELLFVANPVPQLNTTRLTLTADVINSAANVIFLVSGEKKADILYEVLRGDYKPDDHPSQRIHPVDGLLTVIADQAAAARLRSEVGAK